MSSVKSVLIETQTPPLFLAQQSREGKKKENHFAMLESDKSGT
jgi:hypothetical protein